MSSVRERGWGCAEGAAESHMECTEGYCTVTGFAGNFLYTCSLSLRASRSPVRKGFASSQTARDVSQNSENKVFRLWTLFWDSFGYPLGSILAPFWSPFGVVFDPFGLLGVSSGSFDVPLGLLRVPLGYCWCPAAPPSPRSAPQRLAGGRHIQPSTRRCSTASLMWAMRWGRLITSPDCQMTRWGMWIITATSSAYPQMRIRVDDRW